MSTSGWKFICLPDIVRVAALQAVLRHGMFLYRLHKTQEGSDSQLRYRPTQH